MILRADVPFCRHDGTRRVHTSGTWLCMDMRPLVEQSQTQFWAQVTSCSPYPMFRLISDITFAVISTILPHRPYAAEHTAT